MSPHTDPGALLKLAERLVSYPAPILGPQDLQLIAATLRQAASHGSAGGEAVAWTNEAQLGFLKDPACQDIPMAMWSKEATMSDVPLYRHPAQASTELCDCGYAEDVQERIAKLQSEAGFYQCLYESAVKRLEHIAVVCTQQMDRDCNHRMALDGVRQIANDYLALPSAECK